MSIKENIQRIIQQAEAEKAAELRRQEEARLRLEAELEGQRRQIAELKAATDAEKDRFLKSTGVTGFFEEVHAYLSESSGYPLEIVELPGFVNIQRDRNSHPEYGTWEEVNITAEILFGDRGGFTFSRDREERIVTPFLVSEKTTPFLRIHCGIQWEGEPHIRLFDRSQLGRESVVMLNVLQQVQDGVIEAIAKKRHIYTAVVLEPGPDNPPSYDW